MKPVPELYERFPGLGLTLPDVVFTDTTKVTLPGVTLHLEYRAENGHSHSKGDTTIYFEEEEILIAGDLLYTEVHPVTFFGNIPNWLTALKAAVSNPLQDNSCRATVRRSKASRPGEAISKRCTTTWKIFTVNLQEIKSGRKSPDEVAKHMLERHLRRTRQDPHGRA